MDKLNTRYEHETGNREHGTVGQCTKHTLKRQKGRENFEPTVARKAAQHGLS